MSSETINPMQKVRIQKLCINCCVGESGEKLNRALKVLEQISGQKPKTGKSRITIRGFGIRRNEKISCYVTVRGPKAEEILSNALKVKEFEIKKTAFSENGNFGFGIEEHIDLGIKYDPSIGIFGMDFFVVLEKPGVRVSKRRRQKSKVGNKQRVSKDDAMSWFVKNFDGILINK